MKRFALYGFLAALFISSCAILYKDAGRAQDQPSNTETRLTEAEASKSPEPQAKEQQEQQEQIAETPTGIAIDQLIPKTTYSIEKITPKFPDLASAQSMPLAVKLCEEVGAKLGSVDESDCLKQKLLATSGRSVEGREMAIKNYPPKESREPLGRVLVIGGIHGDEFSSVSVVFKWMDILNRAHSGMFDWRFIPVANPDGLLNEKSQRQNANGVDLNRNFPTADWSALALSYWQDKTYKNLRRYPGETANSEPETQWLVDQINTFQPDVIISMHAPYHLVDYDGPPKAPDQLGSLYLRKLGVYPGSLGNYAGVDMNLPIVTVELASAGSMPTPREISAMWDDLISWLRVKLNDESHAAD